MGIKNWTDTTVGQLCDDNMLYTQTGPFGSSLHKHDYVESGVPVIPTEAIGRRLLRPIEVPQVDDDTADRLRRHKVKVGDILFARRGVQATGLSAIMREQNAGWICGTGAILLRVLSNDIDPTYLSFVLASDTSHEWLRQHAVGAVMPNLNETVIRGLPLSIPPLGIQQSIASILGTLDDKIELNRRMNETLESMAQALFKSWFVDFDPVIDNALAAGNPIPEPLRARAETRRALGDQRKPLPDEIQKLFPDAFVFDDEMGWIPEGWESKTIGETIDLSYGKSLPASKRIEGKVPVYGSGGISGWHNESFVNGPGIIVGRKGTVGSLYWVDVDFFPIDTVFYVENRSNAPLYWLYQSLQLFDIKSMGADSAVPGVNRNAIYSRHISLPSIEVWEAYSRNIDPVIEKQERLKSESDSLAKLRDTLLPKLLSGKLRIPDAEKLVADSL